MVGPGRILIAGGGIAGLTLAAALQRRGIEPVLVERSTAWEAVGAGIAVQPNGLRALRALGMTLPWSVPEPCFAACSSVIIGAKCCARSTSKGCGVMSAPSSASSG